MRIRAGCAAQAAQARTCARQNCAVQSAVEAKLHVGQLGKHLGRGDLQTPQGLLPLDGLIIS